MTTLFVLFLDTDTRGGVMFVTSGVGGVLVEGVRPGRDPVRAAISATDAVDVLEGVWAGRVVDLPAMDGVTGLRRLRFWSGPQGVEVSIRSRAATLGRWLVHADRVPELGDALRRALTTARTHTTTGAALGTNTVPFDTEAQSEVAVGIGAGGAVAAALQVVPGGRR
ncbi:MULTISPECIES: hypothetical protein [Actinoalloteichus]|uniref:Uncharacterized protein n=1 Tax=Actinoalloteichus fjordicus TaxID=1612552 RepID=A0AAC9LIK6_9PSEU|nr:MULTISPECIES: hypothetical protein [Actinoalloteichus]APU17469.1 hypothetical protein UA74_27330 [Actinoalloteichus fjordicus]APU23546.1 hypothetical protein UA75_27875 [Actinoalloteichus sp. GBA129-24]